MANWFLNGDILFNVDILCWLIGFCLLRLCHFMATEKVVIPYHTI